MAAPEGYLEWINSHLGFNPRSQANSDALSDLVVTDLRQMCPAIRSALDRGDLNARKNPGIRTAVAERSIDLVLHENGEAPQISVRVSVEHKTIMTAHGKARKNRYGDIIAYANHMHNHSRKYDGVNVSRLVTGPLAPQPTNAVYYDNFIQRICDPYRGRFSRE